MNLVERYHVIHILKTLHSHLIALNKNNFKTAFAKARSELVKNNMCSSMSIHLKDQNTVMVLAGINGQQYVLLWDLRKKEIVYKGVKKNATS